MLCGKQDDTKKNSLRSMKFLAENQRNGGRPWLRDFTNTSYSYAFVIWNFHLVFVFLLPYRLHRKNAKKPKKKELQTRMNVEKTTDEYWNDIFCSSSPLPPLSPALPRPPSLSSHRLRTLPKGFESGCSMPQCKSLTLDKYTHTFNPNLRKQDA